jgi:hypothetical protein
MSRGDLQEMEVGTKQSKTAVNAGAKAAESMQKISGQFQVKLVLGKIWVVLPQKIISLMMIQQS